MTRLEPSAIQSAVVAAVKHYKAVRSKPPTRIFGIPRGGMAAAYLIGAEFERRDPSAKAPIVDSAIASVPTSQLEGNLLIVDDICDSGATLEPWHDKHWETMTLYVRDASKKRPTFFGVDLGGTGKYIEFPWDEASGTPEQSVVRLIEFLGRDPNEPSLKETPRRFLDMLRELSSMHDEQIELTTFDHTGDDLAIVRDIPFNSLCEHHIMAYSGVMHIGYLPKIVMGSSGGTSRILGLSKFARVVAKEAAGLTTQEAVTLRVANAIAEAANTADVAVVSEAQHSCMILRGAKAFGTKFTASAMLGQFRTEPSLRAEFLALLR